jgi:pimeloyl-ACP methyl ester carboxylesterase
MSAVLHSVRIQVGGVTLDADAEIPRTARGVVLFAHGSGSSRHSPRNRQVARMFHPAGLATVLADLLTEDEERADRLTGAYRFDIGLLAERVIGMVDWAARDTLVSGLGIGLFGASTGAAAALVAAAARPDDVRAIVSRGGRPDLAEDALSSVRQPTLLIVGELDDEVLDLNSQAIAKLGGSKALSVVAGATHLFEEPGALEQVARLARDWFVDELVDPAATGGVEG